MSLNYDRMHNLDIREFILKAFDYAKYLSAQNLTERNCPVCDSDKWYLYTSNGYLNYCRCRQCTHLYMNPAIDRERLIDGFEGHDELMMEYFNIMSKYKSGIPQKTDPLTDSKLVDIYKIKQSGKLLDIGCAFGDFLHKAKHFYDVEGVEVNPFTAAIAEKYFTVHKDYLSNLKLAKEYDIVRLHEILYGTYDPVTLLKEIHDILKEDGILYIHSGNSDSYAMQLYQGKVNHLHLYTMLNVFNRKSIEKLGEMTGFRIRTFRTEWLDIYLSDLTLFLDGDESFIHKKNIQVQDYEEKIKKEDELQKSLNIDLKDRGNYLMAILEKR